MLVTLIIPPASYLIILRGKVTCSPCDRKKNQRGRKNKDEEYSDEEGTRKEESNGRKAKRGSDGCILTFFL